MNRWKRVILITLDGVGVGAQPDADAYGDAGADTLGHVARACDELCLPNLAQLGLGNIVPVAGVAPAAHPLAAYGRMQEASAGKDTTTGHWEIAGLIQREPFPSYPLGFPEEIMAAFRRKTRLDPLGNIAASGTEILRRLGEEHCRTGRPIVYTSVDSVFQIAAHEEVIPVEKLYDICRTAREILDPYRICRVIARPFAGQNAESFKRTAGRRDFSMEPNGITLLDRLLQAKLEVHGIGKIKDIFAGRGLSSSVSSSSNADGMIKTTEALSLVKNGLIFTNLVDFDTLFGHRLDPIGFGRALEGFDRWLPGFMAVMDEGDLLILTADHGCDPTTPGTDHTREYVPLLVWHKGLREGFSLGVRETFADLAATVGELFSLPMENGTGFAEQLESCDPAATPDRGKTSTGRERSISE
ncbi:MAG: phosphopentomutase [Syntrophotaleaceae bacterium]